MTRATLQTLLVVLVALPGMYSEKILVVNFMNSKSVKNFYSTLYVELADSGHNLTIISPFKTKDHPRIRDIVGRDIFSSQEKETEKHFNAYEDRLKGQTKTPLAFTHIFADLCRSYYEMPEIQELLQGKENFDLIIATYTFNECGFGLIHRLQVPFILLHANIPLPWNNPLGVPYPLSHNPLPYFGYSDSMTFKERFVNFGVATIYSFFHSYWGIPQYEAVYRQFLGQDTPSVDEIVKNVSLIFSNSHHSLNFPREVMPDLVEIGGMHCHQAKSLPKDLQDFVDTPEGFIYFSFGSIVKASTMPEEIRLMFLSAFSKLKENVLWKWEAEDMTDLPKNVRLGKWLPQQDLLGSPKIRLFITHGGLHSVEEAVYHGTPVLGMPFYGDQDANMKIAEHFEFAKTIQLENITEEIILNSIKTMLADTRYKENALKMSKIFKDRLDSPLEKAVFWTNYIIRHKGAPHLRSPARNMNPFVYHSLDVIFTILLSAFLFMYIIWKTIKLIIYCTCSPRENKLTRDKITLVKIKKQQ